MAKLSSTKIFGDLDVVGKIYGSLTGNADTSTRLLNARTISLTGDVTGSVSFDGTSNVSITTVIVDDSHNHIISNIDGLQSALDLKSPIASPTFTGTVTAPTFVGALTGNASTATKLYTARTINGVSFDGSQNITINAVDSTSRIATSLMGVANGVATLDSNGYVPASQLPSYVDDVLEYANLASLPVSGENGKLYVTLDNNKVYRWSGSTYIEISADASTADAATKLATARTISLTGDATGSVSFDGSQNVSITVAVVDDSHNHIISNIDGLQSALDGKSATGHTHTIANVTGLQSALDLKSPLNNPTFTGVVTAPTFIGALTGNASTATKLATARSIGVSGITGTAQLFDGSSNIIIPITAIPSSLLTGIISNNNLPSSSESNKGIVQLASNSETVAGTVTTKAVTPAGLAGLIDDLEGIIYYITLLASNWVGENAPYTYEITSIENVTSDSNIHTITAEDITKEQLDSLVLAQIVDGGLDINSITFNALGIKPAIDIPIRIIVSSSLYVENHYLDNTELIASESLAGIVRLATSVETLASTDNAIAVTPKGLSDNYLKLSGGILTGDITATNFIGNSSTTTKLTTARTISLSGDVTGSVSFDGSQNVTITAAIVDDSHNHIISNIDGLQSALNLKSPIANPTFTGIPLVPTAILGTNTNQIASTLFVQNAVDNISTNGIANSANKLATARTINGVAFDGTANITVADSTKLPLSGGSLSGDLTFPVLNQDRFITFSEAATGYDWRIGYLGTGNGNANYLTFQSSQSTGTYIDALKIGVLDLDATFAGNVTAPTFIGALTGNASTATKLYTARTINGISFNGTQNITINAVDSTPRIASSLLGVANGVATLDSNGLVPSSQLPSYVDDVLEYTNLAGLPASGETSKLYVTLDTNKIYRWSGSIYVEISANASTADAAIKLATARTISLSGDVTGSVSFDGTSNVTITAVIVDDSHNHIISNIDGLQAALDGRALLSHTHTIANVTGLQTAIDARAPIASPTFTGVVTSPSFVGPLTGNASTATSAISVTGSQATDISNALAHKLNNGTDHSYINQDLKTTATVRFAKLGVGVASPVESVEVSGKVKSSNGFVAGNFEIVYNATESSLDFCLLS